MIDPCGFALDIKKNKTPTTLLSSGFGASGLLSPVAKTEPLVGTTARPMARSIACGDASGEARSWEEGTCVLSAARRRKTTWTRSGRNHMAHIYYSGNPMEWEKPRHSIYDVFGTLYVCMPISWGWCNGEGINMDQCILYMPYMECLGDSNECLTWNVIKLTSR